MESGGLHRKSWSRTATLRRQNKRGFSPWRARFQVATRTSPGLVGLYPSLLATDKLNEGVIPRNLLFTPALRTSHLPPRCASRGPIIRTSGLNESKRFW